MALSKVFVASIVATAVSAASITDCLSCQNSGVKFCQSADRAVTNQLKGTCCEEDDADPACVSNKDCIDIGAYNYMSYCPNVQSASCNPVNDQMVWNSSTVEQELKLDNIPVSPQVCAFTFQTETKQTIEVVAQNIEYRVVRGKSLILSTQAGIPHEAPENLYVLAYATDPVNSISIRYVSKYMLVVPLAAIAGIAVGCYIVIFNYGVWCKDDSPK